MVRRDLVRFHRHDACGCVPMKRPGRRRPAPVALAEPCLDLSAAGPLAASLLRRRGSPLALDGSAVERLGGQCLQVLLAAADLGRLTVTPFELCPRPRNGVV